MLRVTRTKVIKPADMTAVTIDARYMGALERTGAEAKGLLTRTGSSTALGYSRREPCPP
jgi:hypothetical protein